MSTFSVLVPGGVVEPFVDIGPTSTVGEFKAVVGARVGMKSFRLYVKNPTEGTGLLTRSDDGTLLKEVGSVEFQLKKQGQGWAPAKQAQRRMDRGLTQVATSLSSGFKAVGGKVDGVKRDTKQILESICGEAPAQREGQSDCARLKEIRHIKGHLTSEAESLREREERRKSDQRLQRSESAIATAEQADGNAELATASLDGATLEEKAALLKAQSKIVAIALRKQKAEERKATAAPKVAAKRRRTAKAVAAQDPDQSIEKEL